MLTTIKTDRRLRGYGCVLVSLYSSRSTVPAQLVRLPTVDVSPSNLSNETVQKQVALFVNVTQPLLCRASS